MNVTKTFATTARVLHQLRHDHRTVALLFVVPPVLLTVLKYVFQSKPDVFEHVAPMLLGIFPMIMMFLVTSIVTIRERTSGTLDRLMTMPISKTDFIVGYAIAFSLLGLIQASIAGAVMLGLLGVTVMGGVLPTILGTVAAAFLGTSLGLFTSAFARSEWQAMQFLPAFVFPQLLTCGLFIARDQMAGFLHWFSNVMPLTYSVDGLKQAATSPVWSAALTKDLLVVAGFGVAALILGSATVRRKD